MTTLTIGTYARRSRILLSLATTLGTLSPQLLSSGEEATATFYPPSIRHGTQFKRNYVPTVNEHGRVTHIQVRLEASRNDVVTVYKRSELRDLLAFSSLACAYGAACLGLIYGDQNSQYRQLCTLAFCSTGACILLLGPWTDRRQLFLKGILRHLPPAVQNIPQEILEDTFEVPEEASLQNRARSWFRSRPSIPLPLGPNTPHLPSQQIIDLSSETVENRLLPSWGTTFKYSYILGPFYIGQHLYRQIRSSLQ